MNRRSLLTLIYTLSNYVAAATIFLVPLFFLPITTDFFDTAKQALFVTGTLILLVLYGVRGIVEGKFTYRHGPFNLGLLVLLAVVLISTFSAVARFNSIISAVPWIALILFSIVLINSIDPYKQERTIFGSLLLSGTVVALLTLLQFLKLYVLPYPAAQTQSFALTGSVLESSIFLVALLPFGLLSIMSYLKDKRDEVWGGLSIGTTFIVFIGFVVSVYSLITDVKPLLLPQSVGLKTALQPLGLNFTSALFGTGPGTYLFDFTRFRDAALNAGTLWNIRFVSSSSIFLEILATLGIIGILCFIFLAFRLIVSFVKNTNHTRQTTGLFISLLLLFVLSLFLPFGFVSLFLFFTLLALFTISLMHERNDSVHNLTLSVVALREGLVAFEKDEAFFANPQSRGKLATDLLPYIMTILFAVLAVATSVGMYQFLKSDFIFQQAIVAAQQNKAKETYDLQNAAITTFPYRDFYHRVFSQTNLAIANAIVAQAQGKDGQQGKTLSQEDQQNVVTLVQQSINYARNATLLSPLNVTNWENLGSTYRSLIGFANQAENFAVASVQQAIALDPTNPLLHVELGGIYYQLALYDNAIAEFGSAVQLKPDFANAHYNLGHAYEAKGGTPNLQLALQEYQSVKGLVDRNSDNYKKISDEIAALEAKIPATDAQAQPQQGAQGQSTEPLALPSAKPTLPAQSKVQVTPPPTPVVSSSPAPSITPEANPTINP